MPRCQPIAAIIFDIGRVILRVEPGRALASLADGVSSRGQTGADAEKLWQAIQADALWRDWQEGRLMPAAWHEHLCRRFGLHLSFDEFRRAWNSVIAPEPILPQRLFAHLARRCIQGLSGRRARMLCLVLLSNTDPLHLEHMRKTFRFQRYFKHEIYSCEVGASKPSRTIFRLALRAAQAPAAQTLFIDDVAGYVRVARRFGFQGTHFRGRAQLEAELRKRGLLSV